MITAAQALSSIPVGLRDPLIAEYQMIVQNFLEHRWLPSELSGGRFSEVVYTILDGHAKGSYPTKPSKPSDFVAACRRLEQNPQPHVPRSFRILIPRLLPALYEVRNNRNVGHVGGDVDPNHMDSVAVLSICNWTMGELVRVFHGLSIGEAQKVVDLLAEAKIPLIWSDGNVKRVLIPKLPLPDQILLLVSVTVPDASIPDLLSWTECPDKKHFVRTVRRLHKNRHLEYTEASERVKILPPGNKAIQDTLRKKNLAHIV